MTIRIVIPVRPLDEGKSRLAPILTAAERHALNRWFFEHTVAVAAAAAEPSACIVVSQAADLLKSAQARGLQTLQEAADSCLNVALALGAAVARQQGADAVLSLSCDLPFLTQEDVRAMLTMAERADIVIAPDLRGTGTNALLMPTTPSIPYLYGSDSCDAHARAAAAAGLSVAYSRRPGTACDIDTPEDYTRHEVPAIWPTGRG